jgi:adenine deaminase
MRTAVRELVRIGGGLATAKGEEILEVLPLPRAGLISDRPLADVRAALDALTASVRALGCTHADPVMALSFVALEVIPSLKLTDRGLVDVEKFDFVPLEVGD